MNLTNDVINEVSGKVEIGSDVSEIINQLKELRREEQGLHPVLQALENEKAAIVKMRREAEEAAQKKVAEAEAKRQRDRAEAAQREAEEKMQRDRAEALQREAEAKRHRDRAEVERQRAEVERQRAEAAQRAEAQRGEAFANRWRDEYNNSTFSFC
jgi:membrane protein involved in colicin uptake